MISKSLFPHIERRKPFLTYETHPDYTGLEGSEVTMEVVNVPTASGTLARIALSHFNYLMAEGYSDQWWMHSNGGAHAYVRTTRAGNPRKTYTVARLIGGGAPGTHIRYRDHNPLNLLFSNLVAGEPAVPAKART